MKKWLVVLLSVGLLFGMVGCNKKEENNIVPETDAMKFKKEYESYNGNQNSEGLKIELSISEENPIVYAGFDEIMEILKNGTGIIYFGFPTCPWCRNIVPVLIDAAKEQNIDKIYYLDPSSIRDNGTDQYEQLKSYLSNYLEVNSSGEKTLYVPDVYFVKYGKIVGHHLGSVNSQTSAYTPLTDIQHSELKLIYQNLIKNMQ